MRPAVDAFIVLAAVFGSGLLGLSLRSVLPVRHLQEDSLGMLAGAIFMIEELNRPLEGFLKISGAPIQYTLSHIGQ
jgi:hypothetical protein